VVNILTGGAGNKPRASFTSIVRELGPGTMNHKKKKKRKKKRKE
jgi:hypothetical protein